MSKSEFELYDELEATHWWFRGRRKILSLFLEMVKGVRRRNLNLAPDESKHTDIRESSLRLPRVLHTSIILIEHVVDDLAT